VHQGHRTAQEKETPLDGYRYWSCDIWTKIKILQLALPIRWTKYGLWGGKSLTKNRLEGNQAYNG
jgi:hypothetical protein